jgi:erythromycin esterase-like protein
MLRWVLVALALVVSPGAASAQARDPAMDAAVRDLCHRQIVMLGEASHGDGATFAFKATLIRRLVTECGYDAVLFESSHYDFVELMRRLRAGEEATPAMLSSSIGAIWNRYAELSPLVSFLFGEARAGRLTLGGLDDQIGSAGAFFSLDAMPVRLTALLPTEARDRCREVIHNRIYSGQPTEPLARTEMNIRLLACTEQMMVVAANRDDAHLAQNMAQAVSRDLVSDAIRNRGRDESLYRNLQWYVARLGPRARFIIWTQNAHAARDATASPNFAGGGNLGSYVHRDYGRHAFALGFSAYGGAWRSVFSLADEPIVPAPPGTLEALALTGAVQGSVYRNNAWLARIGRVPGQPFFYHQTPADWARVFDGMVVFRAERAPTRPAS